MANRCQQPRQLKIGRWCHLSKVLQNQIRFYQGSVCDGVCYNDDDDKNDDDEEDDDDDDDYNIGLQELLPLIVGLLISPGSVIVKLYQVEILSIFKSHRHQILFFLIFFACSIWLIFLQLQPDLTVQSAPCHTSAASSSQLLQNSQNLQLGNQQQETSSCQEEALPLFTASPDPASLLRRSPRSQSPILRLFSLESRYMLLGWW